VVIPYREEMAKRHLKVAGDLGKVVFMVRPPARARVARQTLRGPFPLGIRLAEHRIDRGER